MTYILDTTLKKNQRVNLTNKVYNACQNCLNLNIAKSIFRLKLNQEKQKNIVYRH